jgi:hypothetical protein
LICVGNCLSILIMNDELIEIPRRIFKLESVKMTTQNQPTKEEFLEALTKNGINSLEDLVEALLPSETGGFSWTPSEENDDSNRWLKQVASLEKAKFGFWWSTDDEG